MSHYVVAVFTEQGQSLDNLLDPFYEGIEVDPYICETKAEIIESAKKMKERILERMNDEEYVKSEWHEKYLACETDEDFYKAGTYEDEIYDKEGNRLTTYNPKSKWDWYNIGGRWSNMLKTKSGKMVNSCLVKNLDLSVDENKYNNHIRFWELVVEEQPLKEGEEKPFNWYKKECYIERYGTKENYARINSQFSTYAVLTPDGEWYEPGRMGWWGISHANTDSEKEWDENYHKFLEEADPNWTITIVDCHI